MTFAPRSWPSWPILATNIRGLRPCFSAKSSALHDKRHKCILWMFTSSGQLKIAQNKNSTRTIFTDRFTVPELSTHWLHITRRKEMPHCSELSCTLTPCHTTTTDSTKRQSVRDTVFITPSLIYTIRLIVYTCSILSSFVLTNLICDASGTAHNVTTEAGPYATKIIAF